ncbi:MAG TPA: hypothetical protein DD490_11640, partial [Acidobacteria bacterium]|nr:hypothetical protein [Acidobacteriota bacterium]
MPRGGRRRSIRWRRCSGEKECQGPQGHQGLQGRPGKAVCPALADLAVLGVLGGRGAVAPVSVAVRAAGLSKAYRDGLRRVEVLREIDLAVEPGEMVAIVGPSGSGKSTLLHLLGALDRPDAGSVVIGGTSLAGMSGAELAAFRNRTIGFVFQFHQLLPDFTALENVMLPGRIAGREPGAVHAHARDLLAEVGLAERFDHFPSQLSGGERQRVA